MKRTLLCALLALAAVLSLAACGGKPGSAGSGDSQTGQTSQGGQASSGDQSRQPGGADVGEYVFRANGVNVSINDDMAGVLAALGEPQSYFEAESCAFEGLDKTYTYSGFVITTRPEGEKDYVNSILLTDDSVTTPEGIFIGSSGDDVIAAYGQSPAGFATLLTYTKNGTVLNFVLSEDKVISLEYLAE